MTRSRHSFSSESDSSEIVGGVRVHRDGHRRSRHNYSDHGLENKPGASKDPARRRHGSDTGDDRPRGRRRDSRGRSSRDRRERPDVTRGGRKPGPQANNVMTSMSENQGRVAPCNNNVRGSGSCPDTKTRPNNNNNNNQRRDDHKRDSKRDSCGSSYRSHDKWTSTGSSADKSTEMKRCRPRNPDEDDSLVKGRRHHHHHRVHHRRHYHDPIKAEIVVPPPPPPPPPPEPCPQPEPQPEPLSVVITDHATSVSRILYDESHPPPAPRNLLEYPKLPSPAYSSSEEFQSDFPDDPATEPDPDSCPVCGEGRIQKKFTWTGIMAGILLFPCGIYCCFKCRASVCTHCGAAPLSH